MDITGLMTREQYAETIHVRAGSAGTIQHINDTGTDYLVYFDTWVTYHDWYCMEDWLQPLAAYPGPPQVGICLVKER